MSVRKLESGSQNVRPSDDKRNKKEEANLFQKTITETNTSPTKKEVSGEKRKRIEIKHENSDKRVKTVDNVYKRQSPCSKEETRSGSFSNSQISAERSQTKHQTENGAGKEVSRGSSKAVEKEGVRVSSPKVHSLPMKGVYYLQVIEQGIKKFEGRINGPMCRSMRVGDQLQLQDRREKQGIICEITSLDEYKSFEEMLRAKGVLNMLPQLDKEAKVLNQQELLAAGVKIYRQFPGSNRVDRDGAVAIGVKFLRKI